ncbi:MAG: RdgB/HAM1 family non-canonical purine NTP pyrophosphatase [Dehalococcoidia bacterium]
MERLLLATSNPGKVREFRRLLDGVPFEIVTPDDLGLRLEVEETGRTYAANAVLKSKAYASAGGCLALADDSGIEVDALDGRPGLYSARYGGPELDDAGRNALLLRELTGVSAAKRGARYVAVVAVSEPTGETALSFGTWEGSIGDAPRGSGGFGYDPLFVLPDGRVSAELTPEEKDALSHRGKAVRAAADYLRSLQG